MVSVLHLSGIFNFSNFIWRDQIVYFAKSYLGTSRKFAVRNGLSCNISQTKQ